MTHRESMVRNIKIIQKIIRDTYAKPYDITFWESTRGEALELVIAALDSLIIDLDPDLTIQNLIVAEILQRVKSKIGDFKYEN